MLAAFAGCKSSLWSSTPATPTTATTKPAAASPAPNTPSEAPPATAATTAATAPPAKAAAASKVDQAAIDQIVSELQKTGDLDAASRERLKSDLQQTDPALWPLVVQQFRAALAYRKQQEQRRSSTAPDSDADEGLASDSPDTPAAAGKPGVTVVRHGPAKTATAEASPAPSAKPSNVATPASSSPDASTVAAGASTKPAASTPSPGVSPDVPEKTTASEKQVASTDPPAGTATQAAAGPVTPASYQPPLTDDFRHHLAAAIRAREATAREASGDDADRAQAQLRVLYLLAGRRDDALRPIAGIDPALQTFWAEELYGLSLWMDSQRTPDDSRRAAEAKEHLSSAVAKLGENCQLLVRNLTFCTKIQSYGCVKPFEKYEFAPGQNVLLYAEVENLTNEATPQGYHTSLQSSYQIFDNRGQRVADDEFTTTEEHCRNPRRDYFIGYEFRMPERIYPGVHTLQLTIRDLKSNKVGQSTIEFKVSKAGK